MVTVQVTVHALSKAWTCNDAFGDSNALTRRQTPYNRFQCAYAPPNAVQLGFFAKKPRKTPRVSSRSVQITSSDPAALRSVTLYCFHTSAIVTLDERKYTHFPFWQNKSPRVCRGCQQCIRTKTGFTDSLKGSACQKSELEYYVSMIKAARKAAANAEPARAFADIFRAPTHEHTATQRRVPRLPRGGVRKCGALRALIIHVCGHSPMSTSL